LSRKSHLFDRVMYFVKVPQKRAEMQQTVDEVLYEIAHDKQDKKLRKDAQISCVENCQIVDSDFQEAFMEKSNRHIGQSVVTNQRK